MAQAEKLADQKGANGVVRSGKITLEKIQSVNPIVPSKGTNAGKTMFVINGVHWSRTEPKREDTHVNLEAVNVDGVDYINVIGFSMDTRMSIQDKIKLVTEHDAAYSSAIALLLK